MKRLGAFLLAFFVLIMSVESSVGMHFCHDVLVETSINQSLSSCCKKSANEDQQPTLSKKCCEIAHFNLEFQDTVVASADVTFSAMFVDVPMIQFDLHVFEHLPKQQFLSFKPPHESPHIPLHILFEQYLI
ncbi:MAG: hypothetical protein CMQ88_01110 [Gammaproteobacteria bacterium]|nr:hypothetical protein [Gammaproteobacteria bacterium]